MLEPAIKGATRPSQEITWTDKKGIPFDLSGATITARIRLRTEDATAVTSDGTFVLVNAPNGVFRWDYAAGDVADAGLFEVQFTASFGLAPTPARTFIADWQVMEAL